MFYNVKGGQKMKITDAAREALESIFEQNGGSGIRVYFAGFG